MGKKLGNDYRLWIEGDTPGTFAEIKGQQDLSITRSTQQIDTSTKDNFPYGTSAPGLRTLSISCSLIPDLPDATGFTELESAANAAVAAAKNFQIRKGGSAGADPADTVFECSMFIGDFPTNFGQNDSVKCNFTLTAEAAPTVDALK